jgi:hypothetical protein
MDLAFYLSRLSLPSIHGVFTLLISYNFRHHNFQYTLHLGLEATHHTLLGGQGGQRFSFLVFGFFNISVSWSALLFFILLLRMGRVLLNEH